MLGLIFHEADIDQRKTLEGNNNNVHIFQAVEKNTIKNLKTDK